MWTHEQEAAEYPARPPAAKTEDQGLREGPLPRKGVGAADAASLLRLQRTVGNTGVGELLADRSEESSPVKDVIGSGGAPLDERMRTEMELSFGHDFGDVRVHTDAKASESAKAINAHAYTSGTDVVFQSDKYSPETESGKRMLAHELTHVVQQKAGPVAGSPAPGGISLSHPGDAFEREADRVSEQVVAGGQVATRGQDSGQSATGVQRQAEESEEEEPVQGAFVQRQEGEEEEAEG